jgi:hypothetical protein
VYLYVHVRAKHERCTAPLVEVRVEEVDPVAEDVADADLYGLHGPPLLRTWPPLHSVHIEPPHQPERGTVSRHAIPLPNAIQIQAVPQQEMRRRHESLVRSQEYFHVDRICGAAENGRQKKKNTHNNQPPCVSAVNSSTNFLTDATFTSLGSR